MLVCARCSHENSEGAKFCEECGFSLAAASASERRKTVTVLFCDLAGSTALGEALDPERLRALLARYFEQMRVIVERHGGTVEKFIGDAVMAVFGVPAVRADDALRAARAAVEMRDALPALGLDGRIGVMTGEVVTGTDERLATGDAVNVAARLEQAAGPGEVLIGQPTLELVREAVDVEPIAPLALKGKAQPVSAYRLLRVREAPERRHAARFVGRRPELALLREAWERTRGDHHCELFTVVGDAGVGKSRLAAEALASMDGTVVRGRCPPYGEGITYWPVVEVLKQLEQLPTDEAVAGAIRSLLGDTDAPTSPDEIAWAFRKTLEQAAAERPLVVVFDDIQWGEETFLDLVEHIALLSVGASMLLLCLARPELADRRPTWPVALRLGPLRDDDVDELIPERLPGSLRHNIARAAAGNPLFVEEMVAMTAETDGDVLVPPTLQALLAARLDQLEPAERSVLERGAIEGEIFHRGAVQALARDGGEVTPRLAALVRKELIRPDTPQLRGEDGFRFRHILIRDAAYDALPKAARAELHKRFAAWLEERGTELVELDEVLGYHLEQACRYLAELGAPRSDDLAAAARDRLKAAGRRAALRQDFHAAVTLFERATTLVPAGEVDLALESELSRSLFWAGRLEDALRRAHAVSERAADAGDRVAELCGRIQAGTVRIFLQPEGATERLAALVEAGLPVFEADDNPLALYSAHEARGLVAQMRQHWAVGVEAYDRAAEHARRAGLPHEFAVWQAACRYYGATPVSEMLAWLEGAESRVGRDHWLRSYRAAALAMLGRVDEARALLAETRAELTERGAVTQLADVMGLVSVDVELWAADPAAAARLGVDACRLFEEHGEQTMRGTTAANLAHALYELEQVEEADAWAGRAAELGASDDAMTQMLWRQASAKVLACRGDAAAAERLAREAVAIGEGGDGLNGQGAAYSDLAEVLVLAGKPAEAAAALEQARERYERKGNVVMAARIRNRLAAIPAP